MHDEDELRRRPKVFRFGCVPVDVFLRVTFIMPHEILAEPADRDGQRDGERESGFFGESKPKIKIGEKIAVAKHLQIIPWAHWNQRR